MAITAKYEWKPWPRKFSVEAYGLSPKPVESKPHIRVKAGLEPLTSYIATKESAAWLPDTKLSWCDDTKTVLVQRPPLHIATLEH